MRRLNRHASITGLVAGCALVGILAAPGFARAPRHEYTIDRAGPRHVFTPARTGQRQVLTPARRWRHELAYLDARGWVFVTLMRSRVRF